tara:strand:+ start:452 stop:718 length:267 start_codon:yes stop_codon:yes gene_type:complete
VSIYYKSLELEKIKQGEKFMPNGTVKWFNKKKGYGFIQPDVENEKDVFVHISAVKSGGLQDLEEGDKLSYELETGDNGKVSAINLQKS